MDNNFTSGIIIGIIIGAVGLRMLTPNETNQTPSVQRYPAQAIQRINYYTDDHDDYDYDSIGLHERIGD